MTKLEQELNTILDDYGFNLVLGNDVSITLLPNRYVFSDEDIDILYEKDFVEYTIIEENGNNKLVCNISQVNHGKVKSIIELPDELLEWYEKNGNTFWVESEEK